MSPEETRLVNQIERPLALDFGDIELIYVTPGTNGIGNWVLGECLPNEIKNTNNESLQQVDRASPRRPKRTKWSELGKVSSGTQRREKS